VHSIFTPSKTTGGKKFSQWRVRLSYPVLFTAFLLQIGRTPVFGAETSTGKPITVSIHLVRESSELDEIDSIFKGKHIVIPLELIEGRYRESPDEPRITMEGMYEHTTIALADITMFTEERGILHDAIVKNKDPMKAENRPPGSIISFDRKTYRLLSNMICIDGKYFRVDVGQDGLSLKLQEVKPDLGILEIKCPGFELLVMSDQCVMVLAANEAGKWELPVGEYKTLHFRINRKELGIPWMLRSTFPAQCPLMNFMTIEREAPLTVMAGDPVKLKFHSSGRFKEGVRFDFNLSGQARETYFGLALKNKVPFCVYQPPVSIIPQTGKRLPLKTVEEPWLKTKVTDRWMVPSNITTEFRFEAKLVPSPFEIQQDDEVYLLKGK